MRIQVAVPEPHVSAPVLDAALEATTRLNESMIRKGELEPFDPENPQAKWRPEPPGQEHFDHGRLVTGRGWGDCDDLAPWHAASLRVTGEDPRAKAFVRKSGVKRWHALVKRGDGSVDDPSLDAGMPGPGRRGVIGAWQPLMFRGHRAHGVGGSVGAYELRPQLALRPYGEPGGEIEAWQARTDLPWHTRPLTPSPTDIAMVSLHASPVPDQALVGSLEGCIVLGEANGADEDHLDRLRCIADMCSGASWEECADEYGPQHATAAGDVVGAFFGKKFRRKLRKTFRNPVFKTLVNPLRVLPGGKMLDPDRIARSKMLRPLVSKGLQFIPGVGPIASSAFDAASPMLQRMLSRGEHEPPPQLAPQYPPAQYPPAQYPPAPMPWPPQSWGW